MKLIQDSGTRVFKSGIPQKSSTVDIMSWIHSLGPARESVAIYDQFCRDIKFRKVRHCFRHETHSKQWNTGFQIGDPTKVFHCGYYVLDTLSRSPPKRISSSIGPSLQRYENFEKLCNDFDMKLIQNSETRVLKSAIPQKSCL